MTAEVADTTGTRTVPVTLLRAAAALLGVYGFGIALWFTHNTMEPYPIAVVRRWVNRPLGIGEDFGPTAIMLLLLCTGFTAAATGFAGRRLVRAYLPVLVVTALAAVAVAVGLDVWTDPPDATIDLPAVLGNLVFASHVAGGTVLVPLAWVVALQLLAWLVALDRRAWPSTVVLLAATAGLSLVVGDHLGRPLLFLPCVLIGHLTWRVLDRTLPTLAGMLLGAGCLATLAGVGQAIDELTRWWYPIAAIFALLLFFAAVRVTGPTAEMTATHPVTRWLADRAEWLILLSGVVGFAVLGLLRDVWPVGVLVALAAVGLAAEAGHRLTAVVRP